MGTNKSNRWENQEEAVRFALSHPSCMLDMDMGTGKTRVAIDVAFMRQDVQTILVVCPKAVIPVWRKNLEKFAPNDEWSCWDKQTGTVAKKAEDLKAFYRSDLPTNKCFVVINYDAVWRGEIGSYIQKKAGFDMIILDESHRAKSAGSKVSKFLALIAKRTIYRMCLSGTPMANSPLDVYGQYRFLDPTIFGTRHELFLQKYAIMGGPDLKFIVGYKNQKELNDRFNLIAYHCKMSDIADRLKLPPILPPVDHEVILPSKDMKTLKALEKEFVAECGNGHVVVSNVLVKLLRCQQICAGFCTVKENVFDEGQEQELNDAKRVALTEILEDISPDEPIVVFCVFKHDLDEIHDAAVDVKRQPYELSGEKNQLDDWKKSKGGVLAVQIQAGAEGVDMTEANHAVYFTLPHSLALYNQSKARLYRPGQTRSVSFIHLLAKDTIDTFMYQSLIRKKDIIEAVKKGEWDWGYTK